MRDKPPKWELTREEIEKEILLETLIINQAEKDLLTAIRARAELQVLLDYEKNKT